MTTLLAAMLLGEASNRRRLAALPAALIGVVIVISGDLLMIGANMAWAFSDNLVRRYLPSGSALTNTTLGMAAGMLLLLVTAMGGGEIVHLLWASGRARPR